MARFNVHPWVFGFRLILLMPLAAAISLPALSAKTTVNVRNFALNQWAMPLTNDQGEGMSGSWAVGRYNGPLPVPFDLLGAKLYAAFDQNGSDGGAFVSGRPGFLAASVGDAATSPDGSDRFTGQRIMVLIGNNPLGLAESTAFIMIDTGRNWEPETGGIDRTLSIDLAVGQVSLFAGGRTTNFTGGKDAYAFFNGGPGMTFLVPIASSGITFTSLVSVTPIQGTTLGGIKMTLGNRDGGGVAAGWKLRTQTTLRSSGQQVVGLPPGIQAVDFTAAEGFATPRAYGVQVVAGELREYKAIYKAVPRITQVSHSGSSLFLNWQATGASEYSVDYRESLDAADWEEIARSVRPFAPGDTSVGFEDSSPLRLARRTGFYRIRDEE